MIDVQMTHATARIMRRNLEQLIRRLERSMEEPIDRSHNKWASEVVSNLKFLHSKLGGRRYKSE